MNEDEYMEEMRLDIYMEGRQYIDPFPGLTWDNLPTLDDWLNA
jgi:hypothetical protein